MNESLRRAFAAFGVCLLGAALAIAQDWKTAEVLPGVDLTKLSAAQKVAVLKILREQDCSCGCGMKLAQCRVVDPACSYSTGLAQAMVDAIAKGKSEADAIAAAKASKWANAQPTKLLEDPVKIPVAGAPVKGPENAPITIIEFSDFQCPYCAAAAPQIDALLRAYPTQIKLIYKQFPLEIHSQADLAAAASLSAQKQGKFWLMYDAMFQHHDDLSRQSILLMAKATGMDLNRFETDIDSTEVRETVVRDVQDGDRAGVEGTPTLFINGQRYNGPITLSYMKLVMDAQLNKKPAQTASAKP